MPRDPVDVRGPARYWRRSSLRTSLADCVAVGDDTVVGDNGVL
jgi:hypothetical protein